MIMIHVITVGLIDRFRVGVGYILDSWRCPMPGKVLFGRQYEGDVEAVYCRCVIEVSQIICTKLIM